MKTSNTFISKRLAACVTGLILAAPLLASAQSKKDVPPPPPPQLEKLEDLGESELKLAKPETKNVKTVERKEGGKVTEVQVRSGPSTYTVKESKAPKGTQAGEANRAAQWTVMEFGGKKETKEVESKAAQPKGPYSTSKTGTTKPVAEAAASSASAANASPASAPVKK